MPTKTLDLGPTVPAPLPVGVRRLPDSEHVACKDCGTLCGPDAPRTTITVSGRVEPPHGRLIEGRSEVTFGQCPVCVRGWAVAGGTHPNPAPFAHLDLNGLYALLASGAW